MSMALQDVIPVMNLIDELKTKGFQVICTQPYVYCKVLKNNSGALELARLPKLRQEPSISMFAIITFVNMNAKASSRSSQLIPRTI